MLDTYLLRIGYIISSKKNKVFLIVFIISAMIISYLLSNGGKIFFLHLLYLIHKHEDYSAQIALS